MGTASDGWEIVLLFDGLSHKSITTPAPKSATSTISF